MECGSIFCGETLIYGCDRSLATPNSCDMLTQPAAVRIFSCDGNSVNGIIPWFARLALWAANIYKTWLRTELQEPATPPWSLGRERSSVSAPWRSELGRASHRGRLLAGPALPWSCPLPPSR